MRTAAILVILAMLAPLSGCYNTYNVPSMQFRKLQSKQAIGGDRQMANTLKQAEMEKLMTRAETDSVTVKDEKTKLIAVTRNTKLFVRSQGGRRYQISPFNFSMNSSQLVASDRDTLIPLSDLKSYEIDLLSNGKTIGVIAVGVGLAVGFIVAIIQTSGEKTFAE